MEFDHGGRASTRNDTAQVVTRNGCAADKSHQHHAWRQVAKQGIPIALTIAVLALFADRFASFDRAAIWTSIQNVTALQWVIAAIATVASFWALGRYDAVMHRHLETGVGRTTALRSGITAIAISQTLGFGLITGALARWRMVPSLSIWQATRVSAVVAASFLCGWAFVAALAVLVFGIPNIANLSIGIVFVCVIPIAMSAFGLVASLLHSVISVGRINLRLPSVPTMVTIVVLAAADTFCAALALYALLPADVAIPFSTLYVAFLLAFGAAMVSGTPGGVGSFEIAMIALLPVIPLNSLLAAIVAYRIIYYAVPAILATVVIAVGPRSAHKRGSDIAVEPIAPALMMSRAVEDMIDDAPRSEAHFIRQGGKSILSRADDTPAMVVAKTGQALVAMGDPVTQGSHIAAIEMHMAAAAAHNRAACIYKCGGRIAATARKLGHIVIPIAQEAWVTPHDFTLETSKRRQLRRKLRKADEVEIICKPRVIPWNDLERVHRAWVKRHGSERGFSMGRFSRDYVRRQALFCAYDDGVLVAYLTFNTTGHEWGLDLMRSSDDMPDGTMHALVVRAIEAARDAGVPRLTLAAVPSVVPAATCAKSRGLAKIRAMFDNATGAAGLAQFKKSFAPHWEPLYVTAPTRLSLVLACFDVARAIACPPPLDRRGNPGTSNDIDRASETSYEQSSSSL